MLGELKVSVKNSIARTEAGSLAGSTLELRDAVINIKEAADIDLYTALKMVTIVPARLLGMDKKIGSIEKGKNANIAVVDEMMNIYSTVIDGKIVYRK